MKKGSALLIVIGMLAFMVMSAVAFSMFMRQNRLPSSFLRQKVTSAQLVKAALAGAMSEIDSAIGDDPYPYDSRDNNVSRRNSNYWHNRVLMPGNNQSSDGDTTATLTLEALAYLPAPLVNTVRYWSRHTSTAEWRSLGYDAGRYAFTAVNVSDYFDINRMRADVMRDSSPSNRISMAYLFENDNHTGPGELSPAAFDRFVTQAETDTYKTRFVSLADFNLALGKKGAGGMRSPFCDFIDRGYADFYGPNLEEAKMQKFVTDSWYPATNTTANALVLTDRRRGQPFDGIEESLDELQKWNRGNEAFKLFTKRLDLASLGALYDYVDEDHIPISLAIPTIEQAPMLTGMRFTGRGFGLKLKIEGSAAVEKNNGTVRERSYIWTVDSLGEDTKVNVSCCGVYPFKRETGAEGMKANQYEVQSRVKVFLSREPLVSTRGSDLEGGSLFKTGGVSGRNWVKEEAMLNTKKGYYVGVGETDVGLGGTVKTEDDTLFDANFAVEIPENAIRGAQVYAVVVTERKNPETGQWEVDKTATKFAPDLITKPLVYLDAKGETHTVDFAKGDTPQLYLSCVAWTRVWDGSNTYDLVPATLADDQMYNGFKSSSSGSSEGGMVNEALCGDREPIVPVSTKSAVFDCARLAEECMAEAMKLPDLGAESVAGMPKDKVEQPTLAIYCDDPRYNWAPEDWYEATGGDVRSSEWLMTAEDRCNGSNKRPGDIFQFVSNRGYLQSMGELQFLPYVRSFRDDGSTPVDLFEDVSLSGKPFADRSEDSLAHRNYAWRTHWLFGDAGRRDLGEENPYNWGIYDSIGGMAVNPFGDRDLMMAAIANTPYDWIKTFRDPEDNGKPLTIDEGRKYCFGPASSEARIEWEELKTICRNLSNRIRNAGRNWETEWASWSGGDGWGTGKNDRFFGVELDNFHDVDRKFLFSYWKNCFANNQQLFLVFVRAEPTVMGGASAGHTPAQLGARAVALVWREPESTIQDQEAGTNGGQASRPHRMRILFYHQFDY